MGVTVALRVFRVGQEGLWGRWYLSSTSLKDWASALQGPAG